MRLLPHTPKLPRRVIAFVGAAFASATLAAQTAPTPAPSVANPPDRAGEAITLTPFEVNTTKDRGYAAGNTLSGSRADTPLAITPASISVMTKEFIDDFAITDMNEAAAWTISMDPPTGGESGPFGGNRFQSSFRGAGNGSNFPSRNGTLQYFISDSYNSERFEFSRGPSTALFGDGGPGGIQGSTSKQARFNSTFTSATARVDSFGGYRTTLDHNYGMDRLALRLNVLHQQIKSYQDGTNNRQDAITLAGTYKIRANTQLRFEFERSSEWNVQYRKTYAEQASIWNRTTVNNDNSAITNPGASGLGAISATQDYLIYNFGVGNLFNYRGNQYQTIGLGYQIPWEGRGDIPGFRPGPSKKFFLGPADSIADRDLNARSFLLEHHFSPDLGVQLAYVGSDVDPQVHNMGGQPGDYRIDVNRLLPNGTPNPNFLKAYSDSGAQATQYQQDTVREYRAIATYRFAVPRWWDMKQRLNLNTGWRQGIFENAETAWRWANNPAQPNLGATVNQLRYRVYWDQPRPAIASALPPRVPGYEFREVHVNTGSHARRARTLTYGQLISHTTFLNERLSLLGSFRRDLVRLKGREAVGFDANYKPISGANGVVGGTLHRKIYQNSESAGVVVYPFPDSLRFLRPVGVVANMSSNFEQISRSINPLFDGRVPPLTRAKTKDIGLRYSIPNGVAYGTVLYYNTDQSDILSAFGSAADFRNIFRNLGYTDPALAGDSAFSTLQDTADRKLEGWEVEITANPTRNLTLSANYGHPLVYTVSDSNGRRAFFAQREAEFRRGAAAQPGQVIDGRTILDPAEIARSLQNIENSFNGFAPGTLTNGLERHRINVFGRYSFTEGRLKGLAINAGANYRGHKKIGSRDARIKFNLPANVTPTPQQDAQAAYDYLWTDPYWDFSAGANYTRRFGRYTTRFQINVTNLLNDDSPRWTSYSTINANQLLNGNPRMQVRSNFTQPDPRKFTFTTTLNF